MMQSIAYLVNSNHNYLSIIYRDCTYNNKK